jgi:serine/threonine protein kinase
VDARPVAGDGRRMAITDNNGPFETVQYSKVRGLAQRFEQAWEAQNDSSSSKGIDLVAFLPEPGDPARLPTLIELIKTDLECRWQRGLPTSLETYVEKFPEIGPIDKISPKLIYEEYRIRTQHGSPAPLTQYKTRFPVQFAEFESLIQTVQSQMEKKTAVSNAEIDLDAAAAQASASPLAMVGNGTIVGGHYALNKRIGTGGFGEVWLGNDIHGNIPKAIKIITRSVESDEAKQELHALEIIKRLNHPYLLRTEGFFAEQERLIVVMELADGSLREMLKKARKETDNGLPVGKLVGYMKHAAEALDYLHEEGIFHRDIKPENILLVGRVAKVADFGLAKLAANRQSTKTNFAGTSAYSSPETWKGRVTAKSDLYSLAVTYAEARLGRAVFKGSTIYEFMIEHLQSEPNLDPLPPEEQAVLQRALAKDPADRYSSCSEFVRDLERAMSGEQPNAGAMPRVGQGLYDNPTPVSKWNTPIAAGRPSSNPSLAVNTQRGLSASTKPASWKTASHPEVEAPEVEPAQPYRRSRRKKGRNPVLVGIGVTVAFVIVASAASLFVRSSVEAKAQEFVDKKDFVGAVKAIDDGGFLATPFKSGLKDDVQTKGLDMAKKAVGLDEKVATIVALHRAFPDESTGPLLLNDAFKVEIPQLIDRRQYAQALASLNQTPFVVDVKADLQSRVRQEWLARGWEEVDQQEYKRAKQIAGEFLAVDPNQPDAIALLKLADAAENAPDYIRMGNYKALAEKLRDNPPAKGRPLRNDLKTKLKTHWLDHANKLNNAKKYEEAQQCLAEFSEYFKNDAEGRAILKTTFTTLFKDFYAKEKYFDALTLLKNPNFEFPELVEDVKSTWRDAEIARFQSGNDAAKEKALVGLGTLSKQFGADVPLQDVYRKYRGEYLDTSFSRIESSLKVRNYPLAIEQINKAKLFVEGAQENKLKLFYLTALVDNPSPSAAERDQIKVLLRDVMKHPFKEAELRPVLEGVVKIGVADTQFAMAIGQELAIFRDVFDDRMPKEFWNLAGVTKVPAVVGSPTGQKLAEAKREFMSDAYAKSLETLHGIQIRNETDRTTRRDYYLLMAKVGGKVALSRTEVLELKPAADEFSEIKQYLTKAMTQTIAGSWKRWPQGDETWATRISDADLAEPDQPIVMAFKAESLLESGMNVDFKLPPGKGDEEAYVDYVRSSVAAKKKEGVAGAAKALEKISPTDDWLVPKRRERISQILRDAAVDLARSPDGSRRLFDSVEDAAKAFSWLDKSMGFLNKTTKDAGILPWEAGLTFALAAACKTTPAFELSKTVGTELLAKNRDKLNEGDRINLVLSNPAAFPDELKALKTADLVGPTEIGAVLSLGESQIAASADAAGLNQRQAVLYALKGWSLEKPQQKDVEAIFSAYSRASSLDPENNSYLLAKGRYGAIRSLTAAASEQNSAAKISLLKQGVNACAAAIKKNLVDDESWADLCLQRSQLALELGNAYYGINEADELKQSFEDARLFAEKARVAKVPHKKPADVLLALANALEDLAQFARVEREKNYRAAAETFDKAGVLNPEYAFNAGRARFRWAVYSSPPLAETQKKDLFKAALVNLATMTTKTKSTHAPEANYWEGMVQWYLRDYAKAFAAFEHCIELGKDKDHAAMWVLGSMDGIAGVTRSRITYEGDRIVQWVDEAGRFYRRVKDLPAAKGYEQTFSDFDAEAHLKQAKDLAQKKDLQAKDLIRLQTHLNKAFELKHSVADKRFDIAQSRAFALKFNRSRLQLSPENVAEIYAQTISAIQEMPNASDEQRRKMHSDFEAVWKKVQ